MSLENDASCSDGAGLTPSDIARQLQGRVLFVRVSAEDLKDPSRGKIDPENPSVPDVVDRLRQWWYIGSWVDLWRNDPSDRPLALVGISGVKHRYVIGSFDLTGFDWNSLECDGKAFSFPIPETSEALDGFGLRGRTVRDGAIFSQVELFKVYDENGPIDRPLS